MVGRPDGGPRPVCGFLTATHAAPWDRAASRLPDDESMRSRAADRVPSALGSCTFKRLLDLTECGAARPRSALPVVPPLRALLLEQAAELLRHFVDAAISQAEPRRRLDLRLRRSRIAASNTTMMRRIVTALAIASAAALSTTTAPRPVTTAAAPGDHDVLLRAARGEKTERTPVWLMRQAGRYMADFRKYSDKIPFRQRSENPEIATELSLQCWRAFGVDGVIMFSDILTILPALGIEFDVVKGKGPQIEDTPRTAERVAKFESDAKKFNPTQQLPFVAQTLKNLRKETEGKTTLVGFVGAPWTLCAYACEGGSTRHCLNIKEMMRDDPATAHRSVSYTHLTLPTKA